MRRNFIVASAMAFAAALGFGQTAQGLAVKSANEIQATNARNTRKVRLPFVSPVGSGNPYIFKEPGLSPKAYGQAFGNGGSRKGKTNFLKLSHNAKVKRR